MKTARREQLYALLGDLPDRNRHISARILYKEHRSSYTLEKLQLDLNGIELVPAYFVYPNESNGRFPTILYNHAHGNHYTLGKEEILVGRQALYEPPYAEALTQCGYAALCIDSWAFGERHGRSESELFKEMLWSGQVLWGMMVYDSMRAVDYLVSRPDVDGDRLGTLGLSMGSTMAWWLAALVPRLKVCIDICCLSDFQALIEAGGLDRHGLYYFVPGLLKQFTTAQINALIAPRPHLSLAGIQDPLTPPAGLDRIDDQLRQLYASEKAPEAWRLVRYDGGHAETGAMRQEIMAFLKKWL